MRGGITSETAILALGRLYLKAPKIFIPQTFLQPQGKKRRVRQHLTNNGLGYNAKETARNWVENFGKLERFWDGSPALLFANVENYEDICKRIIHNGNKSAENPNGFYGFREKMVSMLIHFLMDAEIIPPFTFPVPVDFHVLRILVAHELLVVKGTQPGDNLYQPAVLVAARKLTETYCRKHGVNSLRLGDALWLLSSALCRLHPGNETIYGKREGRRTILRPIVPDWNNPNHYNRYAQACGQCPIERSCRHTVPAGHYYVRGELVIRGSRAKPATLFD